MASFAGVTFRALRRNGRIPMPEPVSSPVVITELAGGNRFITVPRSKAMTVTWAVRFPNHAAYAAMLS